MLRNSNKVRPTIYRINFLHWDRQHEKVQIAFSDFQWVKGRETDRKLMKGMRPEGCNSWRKNEKASDLLPEQFTAHTAPQFGAAVGVFFDDWRIVHTAVLLHALTHWVQITVRHHDLCHPDFVPLAATHREREGGSDPRNTSTTIPKVKSNSSQILHSKRIKNTFLKTINNKIKCFFPCAFTWRSQFSLLVLSALWGQSD